MMGEYGEDLNAQWQLADMLAEDLRWALKRRLEEKLGVEVTSEEATDSDLWLRVDGYAVMQLFLFVAEKLQRSYGVRQISLRLGRSGRFATLDLLWPGGSANLDRLREWQSQPLISGEEGIALTLNEVAERHGGEAWFKVESEASRAYLRLLLPMSQAKTAVVLPAAAPTSRPEYYDFDLFHQPGQRPELDERPLSALTFTVFDSETTGLNIAQGDTIISLSAVRIVNGRLLRQEIFDQLVDPQRPVSPASVAITGITQAMLHGQPTIDRVLPQFHRFAEETVLVAHNAAFDMRLLQLLEAETGVSFINPVLDTLLLSAVAHPDRDDHSMEAIAARLGVNMVGRHTALGDALVTAEIFVKLLPLLKQKGIVTLKQAREAAEQSYLARVQYG
ncbi:MAG: exonuclease domain-containing protein, partial [Caldilineaceae bacterium]